jgi:hypothetical protein
MRGFIRQILVTLRIIPQPDLTGRWMTQHPTPEQINDGVLVAVRDGHIKKWVCFRCPGGCGEKIMLSLSNQRRPHWVAKFDWLMRPTLSPSVRQTNACRCHFWVKRGAVEWCSDSGHHKKQI